MAIDGRKQRESRTNMWRRKKSVYSGIVKAAFRKYAGKSPRKLGRRPHPSLSWEKEKPEQTGAFQSRAMAPPNTTQYLMELVYSDMNITEPSSKQTNYSHRHKHAYSYTSPCTDDDSMDFHHRDFESVYFQNEI